MELAEELLASVGAVTAVAWVGGSGGAWSPDGFDLSDIAPWLVPGTPSTVQERAEKVVEKWLEEKAKDKTTDEAQKALDKFLKKIKTPEFWRTFGKKAIPAIPDLLDAAHHAVNGESQEMTFALSRALIEANPGTAWLGTANTISEFVFPYAPDDWMFPGTDRPLNEGSLFAHAEDSAIAGSEENGSAEMMREGEQAGLEISDRLGIEHEGTRNVFKSVGGLSGLVGRAHRDPADPDKPWIFAVDEPTQDKIRDLLP